MSYEPPVVVDGSGEMHVTEDSDRDPMDCMCGALVEHSDAQDVTREGGGGPHQVAQSRLAQIYDNNWCSGCVHAFYDKYRDGRSPPDVFGL